MRMRVEELLRSCVSLPGHKRYYDTEPIVGACSVSAGGSDLPQKEFSRGTKLLLRTHCWSPLAQSGVTG
jgi:hypothetical protein